MKKVIKKSQLKTMPWKNGLGTTSEIDIFPKGVDHAKNDFQWRISIAQISDKNIFSTFPGYDRMLMVISGSGLKLNGNDIKPFQGIKFHGEDDIKCLPTSGPVEDLGIIFKRDQYTCTMEIIEVTQKSELKFEAGTHFLRALSMNINIDNSYFDKSDTLKIEGPDRCDVISTNFPVKFLKVSLTKI